MTTPQTAESTGIFEDADVVSRYTRQQMIDDGFLVDVSEHAKEYGFKCAVGLTSAVWTDCCEWSDEDTKRQTYQDEIGRLTDVLYMASLAVRSASSRHNTNTVFYKMVRVPRGGRGRLPREVTLKIHFGPGDTGSPVFTIMQPNED